MRFGWCAAAAVATGLAGAALGAPLNPFNAQLLKLPPPERAAKLGQVVGVWCIATKAFYMGSATQGPEAGYAYWSVDCLDKGSYAVQIDPSGAWVVITCDELALRGQGRECFRKF
jgi:hypothetical protein